MKQKMNSITRAIMKERFGHDTLLSVATTDGKTPYVRIVNAYYEDGAFYSITHAESNKMRQLAKNPAAAVCGDWFTARGIGENIGHPRDPKNAARMETLRRVFASWYTSGHVNEEDPHTCILRIRLTEGVLFCHGTRYDIDFT